MSEQLQLRRGTAAQIASFTGAQGECVADITNNRLVVQDGMTAGGFPAAKLSEVVTTTGTPTTEALGINATPDTTNRLAINSNGVLLNWDSVTPGSGDMRVVINKKTAANTASFLYQDNFSERAEIGLCGDDNFHFKVSPDGSTFHDGLIIDNATGAVTLGNGLTEVSDSNYLALATDRTISYSALTAARVITLPSAASYPAGQHLTIADFAGLATSANTLTINTAGSDTINGVASTVLDASHAFIRLICDGVAKWLVTDRSARVVTFTSSGTYYPSAGLTYVDVYLFGAGGGGGGGCLEAASTACSGGGGGGGGGFNCGRFTAAEIGGSQSVAVGSGGGAGAAATSGTTAGGAGGAGGNTTLGTLLSATGGGGGAGGQLSATASGGGGSGGLWGGGGNGSGAGGGQGPYSGPASGYGTNGGAAAAGTFAGGAGAGSSASGIANNGGTAQNGGGGGGSGGGLSASNGTNNGGSGGRIVGTGTMACAGGAGGAAGGSANGGAGTAAASGSLQFAGAGGGGGASATSGSAGIGGQGGAPGGGGGGGGSAQNGGMAGNGGQGGAGLCIIVEHFS